MANFTGGKIESADYDLLALAVNRVYSDTSNGSGGPASLTFSTSDIMLNDVVPDASANNVYTLNAVVPDDNFLIVEIGDETLSASEFSFSVGSDQLTVISAQTASAEIKVYNRYRHIYGWGQEPLSVYPHPTFPTDGIEVSKVLEANINNLIDKTNIMTARVGSDVELTRIAKGNKIYPNFSAAKGDINTIDSVITDEVRAGDGPWRNDISTAVENEQTETRVAAWETQLRVSFRWTFTSYNQARYFFNSGGQCRVSIEMTGDPSDAGYANWSQTVNRMGVVTLDWNTTQQTGNSGISQDVGFYGLTDNYQTVFTSASPASPYGEDGSTPGEYSNEYALYSEYINLVVGIEARYTEGGDGAHHVDIRLTLDDSTFTNQDIDGTTTFNAGYLEGDDVTDNSATFSSVWTPAITLLEGATGGNDS